MFSSPGERKERRRLTSFRNTGPPGDSANPRRPPVQLARHSTGDHTRPKSEEKRTADQVSFFFSLLSADQVNSPSPEFARERPRARKKDSADTQLAKRSTAQSFPFCFGVVSSGRSLQLISLISCITIRSPRFREELIETTRIPRCRLTPRSFYTYKMSSDILSPPTPP